MASERVFHPDSHVALKFWIFILVTHTYDTHLWQWNTHWWCTHVTHTWEKHLGQLDTHLWHTLMTLTCETHLGELDTHLGHNWESVCRLKLISDDFVHTTFHIKYFLHNFSTTRNYTWMYRLLYIFTLKVLIVSVTTQNVPVTGHRNGIPLSHVTKRRPHPSEQKSHPSEQQFHKNHTQSLWTSLLSSCIRIC